MLAITTGYHHMSGFGGDDHEYYICGAVGAYTLLLLLAIFGTCLGEGHDIDMKTEIIYSGFGALLFLFCSIGAMYTLEQDFQLQFLTDEEETQYKPDQFSRAQSIICLTSCLLSALHCLLAVDRFISADLEVAETGNVDRDFDQRARGRLEIYVFGRKGDEYLRKIKWVDMLEKRVGGDDIERKHVHKTGHNSSSI